MSSVPAPAAPDASPHPLLGTTLRGTYRILRTLDQGGMGMVFEAEHVRLKRRVAVKVLAEHLAKDVHALARFNREAEIISQLQHPHVVQVTDFDTTEAGEPYLVMELLAGESLASRLERERCLPIAEAMHITHQVSSGLAAAHAAKIVHRDLKPANIFLTLVPSQGAVVKLLDFGISKRAGAAKGLTGEYDILGTPDYMAPEQALGKTAHVDHRGDQYALAVIAYEMLAGRTPFAGDDVMEVLRQVISSEPPPIETLAPHVPESTGAVLRRALSKSPEQRFPSITEFASALLDASGASYPPPVNGSSVVPAGARANGPSSEPRSRDQRVPLDRYETGLRERPASDPSAPTLYNTFSTSDLTRALDQARQAHGMGDTDLAVNNAETALLVADAMNTPEAHARVDSAALLLTAIFEARLGTLSQRLVVLAPSSNANANANANAHKRMRVSPEQAFLLSRVDGGVTLEETLDLSPLPRQKTLRLLVSMMRQGLIAAE